MCLLVAVCWPRAGNKRNNTMQRNTYRRPMPRASSSSSTTAVNCITHERVGKTFKSRRKVQIVSLLHVCVYLSSGALWHLHIERLQHPSLVDPSRRVNEPREAKERGFNCARFAPGAAQELVAPKRPHGPRTCRGASAGSLPPTAPKIDITHGTNSRCRAGTDLVFRRRASAPA